MFRISARSTAVIDTLDGVMVRDGATDAAELRHWHCVRVDEQIDPNEPLPPAPKRTDYMTDGDYNRAVVARRTCAKCGRVVLITWRHLFPHDVLAGGNGHGGNDCA